MGFEDLASKAAELAGKAAEAAEDAVTATFVVVGELADHHGDKVTDAVGKAAGFVDDKTGGKTAPISGAVTSVAHTVVDTAKKGRP